MFELEKANEPKSYEFSWELIGYDCCSQKISSPVFKTSFQVTEWQMELDLTKLENIDSGIPFRLQRLPNIGPIAVTLDVKITVKLNENKDFKLEKSQTARVFSEKGVNHWAFNIDIPSRKLESKDDLNWLTSKNIIINVEMKTSVQTDPVFPKKYWLNKNSLKGVLEGLKKLLSDGYYPDLLLKAHGEEFKLHKCVLNARWPMLMSHLGIKGSSNEVETKEFSAIPLAMLKYLLEFAYFGNLNFMYELDEIDGGLEIFNLVQKFNFYRLNDQITHSSPKCSSSQILQSYRTSLEMKFTDVTSTDMAMGDFRTCEIPLKPRIVPVSAEPLTAEAREKFEQHIRFMDLRVYVNKGPLGYNWLMFSVVLGKIPKENPVAKCKLYVVGEGNVKYLLTEQQLVFDRKSSEVSFTTPFKKDKTCKRYLKVSEPVITWKELIKDENPFMRKRLVRDASSGQNLEEKDIFFRFEIKLADGEYLHDTRHGECELEIEGDFKIFKDLELMSCDESFTDIQLTANKRTINAHKAILAARSRVLRNRLKEEPNLKYLPIEIKPEDLHIFVHYLYTGQLHELPANKIEPFSSLAAKYDLKCLETILADRCELKR